MWKLLTVVGSVVVVGAQTHCPKSERAVGQRTVTGCFRFCLSCKNPDHQAISDRPKYLKRKIQWVSLREYQASLASHFSVIYHFHGLGKSIWICCMVHLITKILQNFWLVCICNFISCSQAQCKHYVHAKI